MGTRGVWGFRKNGYDKVVYRHYDSYPEGLGYEFVHFLKKNYENHNRIFDNIVEVDVSQEPSPEQIKYCQQMGWVDTAVSNRSTKDWYCLLHELQYPEYWQDAIDNDCEIFIENYIDFISDSLFCEYGYIYDLDKGQLEIYIGFQKVPQEGNRYGTMANDGYYPCKLIGCIDVFELKYHMTEKDAVELMLQMVKANEYE